MTDTERKRFNDFLILNYDMYYSAWLCLVEPLKSQIYSSFLDYNLTGNFEKINFAPASFKISREVKPFANWLKKNCKITYDCFLNLDSNMKKRIYSSYCKSDYARKHFAHMGVRY